MASHISAVSRAALLGFALMGSISVACAQAPSTKPVAKVDGVTITEFDLAMAAEDLGGSAEAQNKEALIGYIADVQIGAKAALDAKIGESAEFKQRLEHQKNKLLLEQYLNVEAKKAVTPAAIRKLYDETIATLPAEQEVRARHILVPTEDEAKAAIARLAKGEDFAKVAAELSQDPGSAKEGGDLGFFSKDRMVPEFAEVAFKMEPGKVSEPVKTQFGYHVIKVDEKRNKPAPNFDDVKEQISQYLERKSQQDIILALRAKAKIERLDQPAETKPADVKKEEPKKP